MKRISAILFSFLVFLTFSTSVFAQELSIPTESITPSPIPTPTAIIYELPYSGLLPGSTLYPIKAIRDKFLELLTTDPAKKSTFYLLQADKRMSASLALFELNKDVLAETTLSKGQNYLEKSIDIAIKAKNSRTNISEILAKIETSAAFQKQEIGKLVKITKGETNQKLKEDYKRALELQKRAEELSP